jgi:hypothetical protein
VESICGLLEWMFVLEMVVQGKLLDNVYLSTLVIQRVIGMSGGEAIPLHRAKKHGVLTIAIQVLAMVNPCSLILLVSSSAGSMVCPFSLVNCVQG